MLDVPSRLEAWSDLLQYCDCMQSVIQEWRNFLSMDFSSGWFDVDEILGWFDELSRTIEVLRHLYVYDHTSRLEICVTASGFPERYHVHNLHHSPHLHDERHSLSLVRKMFLDDLLQTGTVNHWMLKRTAEARAQELYAAQSVLSEFRVRSLQVVKIEDGVYTYRCYFDRYCNRHVPSLYLMLFETSEELTETLMSELSFVLEEGTSFLPLLGNLAEEVDRALVPVRPIWLGRIGLGPVFISGITKDEHELQSAIDKSSSDGEMLAASRIVYEYVQSKGATPVQRLFDAKARRHTALQDYAIRQIDDECRVRKVTSVEKYLFAPHNVIQQLDEGFRRTLGHKLIGEAQ